MVFVLTEESKNGAVNGYQNKAYDNANDGGDGNKDKKEKEKEEPQNMVGVFEVVRNRIKIWALGSITKYHAFFKFLP